MKCCGKPIRTPKRQRLSGSVRPGKNNPVLPNPTCPRTWLRARSSAGQAALEMIGIFILGLTLLGAILILHRIASEDEELLADSRWIAFQCAYQDEHCRDAAEPHRARRPLESDPVAASSANDRSRSVWLERIDSGPSLLRRQSLGDLSLEDPVSVATRFDLEPESGLVSASSSLSRMATATERSFGLPSSMNFAARRLATIRGDWSQDPLVDHDSQTLQRVRDAIKVPAQAAVDPVLAVTDAMQSLLSSLGLEAYDANWAQRPVRTLRSLPPESGCADCTKFSPEP